MPEDDTEVTKKRRDYRQALGILVAIVAAAGVGAFIFLRPHGGGMPLPHDIKKSVSFPLYTPSKLPAGFNAGPSPQSQSGIVILHYLFNGNLVSVSEQSRPNALPNPAKLRQLNLAIGQGWIAEFNGQPAGVVLAGSTMITISSKAQLQVDELSNFMNSLALTR